MGILTAGGGIVLAPPRYMEEGESVVTRVPSLTGGLCGKVDENLGDCSQRLPPRSSVLHSFETLDCHSE